jgi:hypothetical protein
MPRSAASDPAAACPELILTKLGMVSAKLANFVKID